MPAQTHLTHAHTERRMNASTWVDTPLPLGHSGNKFACAIPRNFVREVAIALLLLRSRLFASGRPISVFPNVGDRNEAFWSGRRRPHADCIVFVTVHDAPFRCMIRHHRLSGFRSDIFATRTAHRHHDARSSACPRRTAACVGSPSRNPSGHLWLPPIATRFLSIAEHRSPKP